MVRTRVKKSNETAAYVIVLDAQTEACWKDLKEKFKFDSDDNFLSFLLVMAKNEYSWPRRKRMCLTKEASELETQGRRGRKNTHSVALRFRHLGNKKYEVLNERKEEPCAEKLSGEGEIDANSKPPSAIKTNVNICPLECKKILKDFEIKRTKQILNKIPGKRPRVKNNPTTKDSLNSESQKTKEPEPFPCLELFDSSQLSLKVSDMVKSRFKEEEMGDSFLQPSSPLLREIEERTETDIQIDDENLGAVNLEESRENRRVGEEELPTKNTSELSQKINDSGIESSPKRAKRLSLVLSQISNSSENTQDSVQAKISSPGIFPLANDAEKENRFGEKESSNLRKINHVADGNEFENIETSGQVGLGNDGQMFQEAAVDREKIADSEEGVKCGELIWEPGLPPEFSLRVTDPLHGPSVYANAPLAKGDTLGPVKGRLVREVDIPDDSNMRDIWQVGTEVAPLYLSTRDVEVCDWLRHIRPAPSQPEATCLTTPTDSHLYFRMTRDVTPGEELLYWTDNLHSKWAKKRLDKTSCGGCNLQLGHVLYYRTHCMLFHDPSCSLNVRKYYCKVCEQPILGKDRIISHAVEAHQGRGAYQCQFCLKFFLRLRHLELHRNYGCARNPNRSKVKCDLCGREFSQPQKLKTHKRRMHNDMEVVLKEFQCADCKKVLGSGAGLLRHKKEVHNKDTAAATCDRCGKIFQNKSNLKIHMLTHSGVKPFKCQETDCTAGFTTKQRLQAHYKNTHGITSDALPQIQRSVAFTFDAYSGTHDEQQTTEQLSPPPLEENQSEGMSPLSVGCSADLPPLSVPRPDEYSEDEGGEIEEEAEGGGSVIPYVGGEGGTSLPSKGSRKWLGSPALYRIDNYSASLLVEEAICAAEKDIIEKDVMDGVLPYDALPPYIASPPLEEPREELPRDYSANSPPLEDQRDILRTHLYPASNSPLDDHREMLRCNLYNTSSPPLDESRELRPHVLARNYTPPLMGFKINPLSREYCATSPPLDEPRDLLKTNPLLRDYNISSLIREHLQDGDHDGRGRGLIDPGKDPEVSEYRSGVYRDESRDLYRREGYDVTYPAEGEAQNLSLKEKTLQLDLSYKAYEGLEELDRIGRDPAGLENLLVGDQAGQTLGRSLHLSPRYPPTYDAESMDLSLPRLPYPPSPIYSLDLPGRFDLPSGRLVDLRSHLGLSPHRFRTARVVSTGGGSPPSSSYLYQSSFATSSARHSPTPSYHPYSAYY